MALRRAHRSCSEIWRRSLLRARWTQGSRRPSFIEFAKRSPCCAGWSRWRPGDWGSVPAGLDVRELLRAEVLRSLTGSSVEDGESRADELAGLVWKLLGPSRATTDDNGMQLRELGVDALLLARFLAAPGREEDG